MKTWVLIKTSLFSSLYSTFHKIYPDLDPATRHSLQNNFSFFSDVLYLQITTLYIYEISDSYCRQPMLIRKKKNSAAEGQGNNVGT